MQNRKLEKSDWQKYFDRLSKSTDGNLVEIEVAGLDLGDQVQERWTPLEGISYDPRSDAIYIHTEALDHPIQQPQEVTLTEEDGALVAVAVRDPAGTIQMIRFRTPLPPPGRDRPTSTRTPDAVEDEGTRL